MVTVNIAGSPRSIKPGLTKGEKLYSLAEILDQDKLLLDIEDEVDIPIDRDDYIILRGNENFVPDQTNIDDNPTLKNPVSLTLNDDSIPLSEPKITGEKIKQKDSDLSKCQLYADLPGLPDQLIADECRLVIHHGDCFITIPMSDDNIADIEECTKHDRRPPKKQDQYKIRIDGKKYIATSSHLSGKEILNLAGKAWQEFSLQRKFKGGKREPIEQDQSVDLSTSGVERFETVPKHPNQGERWTLTYQKPI